MTTPTLPGVERDDASANFFDAAGRGQLLIGHCADCDRRYGPEVRSCSTCGRAVKEVVAAGTAVLVSWAVVHAPPLPVLAADAPYTTAVVEFAEGPWLVVRLVHEAVTMKAGMPLRVAFAIAGDEFAPVFAPGP